MILAVAVVCVLAAALSRDAQPPAHASKPPNVVFILTDDLSWDLVKYMPHVQALQRRGATFDHYFVADSLCCPSRATIFTGEFPHDTGVVSNTAPLGGYAKFQARRLERRTFAVALQQAGYATSLLGKYLNGYGDPVLRGARPRRAGRLARLRPHGLPRVRLRARQNGHVATTRPPTASTIWPSTRRGSSGARSTPFLLEVATFAPHAPTRRRPQRARLPRLDGAARPVV